jgi:hypothetical protein
MDDTGLVYPVLLLRTHRRASLDVMPRHSLRATILHNSMAAARHSPIAAILNSPRAAVLQPRKSRLSFDMPNVPNVHSHRCSSIHIENIICEIPGEEMTVIRMRSTYNIPDLENDTQTIIEIPSTYTVVNLTDPFRQTYSTRTPLATLCMALIFVLITVVLWKYT